MARTSYIRWDEGTRPTRLVGFLVLLAESLNSYGHPFQQYQQNERSRLILTYWKHTKKTTTYYVGILVPDLRQTP
jgi:hypothetical protein